MKKIVIQMKSIQKRDGFETEKEREAIQALAVLEASAKSCGSEFHAEVGKFKFLNEMIKLVSPKYLGPRTPEHVKKKVMS